MGVELTVVLRTGIAGAGTKSENMLLFGMNHCANITPLIQRLLKRCSVVKLLNISVRELAFKISCSEGNRGKARMKRETQTKAAILQFLHPSGAWETRSIALAWKVSRFPSCGELLQKC